MPEHVNRVVERARTAAMAEPPADQAALIEELRGQVAEAFARIAQLEEQATQDAVSDLTAWSGRAAAISEPVIEQPVADDGPLPAETDSEDAA